MRVFDSGSRELDRYTAFPFLDSDDAEERTVYLGFSEGGRSVSMWGALCESEMSDLTFLGKEIGLSGLSNDSRKHLLRRVKE